MYLRQRQFNRDAAFTRTELTFIAFVVALVVAMAALALTQARYKQQRRACITNLKNVGLAYRIWNSNGDRFPFEVSTNDGGTMEYTNVWQHLIIFSNELSTPKILICPASRKFPAPSWQCFSDQNVSYFVGLSAVETYPQSFLTGDAGFLIDGKLPQSNPVSLTANTAFSYPESIHRSRGNVGMGDGSVQQISASYSTNWSQTTGLATNLLLLPR